MDNITWTGADVTALRQAYRSLFPGVSDEMFAYDYLRVSPRTIYDWARRPETVLRPATQRLLHDFFYAAPNEVRARFDDARQKVHNAETATHGPSNAVVNHHVAADDLAAMRAFRAADLQVGGGHLYGSVVHYLKRRLAPRLFDDSSTDSISSVFAAGSGLTEMAGWMAHDAGRDDSARRHFDRALEYAALATDRQMQAHVLGSLTHLADHIGSPVEAIGYSKQAHEVLQTAPNPALQARLLALEARAVASMGDSAECGRLLVAAERALEQEPCGEPSVWISQFDEGSLASETVRCMRQLSQFAQARRGAERIIELRKGRARSHAFGLLGLAQVLLAQPKPEPEEACAVASEVLDTTQSLSSHLVIVQLQDFHRQIAPYSSNRAVGAFCAVLTVKLRERAQFYDWLANGHSNSSEDS